MKAIKCGNPEKIDTCPYNTLEGCSQPNCIYAVEIEVGIDINGKVVSFEKLPCAKCERASSLSCPKPDCWNKDGKYTR